MWSSFVLSVLPVSIPRVGHSHPRGKEPDQPDADDQPSQEDHCSGGPQAPMGLRKCPNLRYYKDLIQFEEWLYHNIKN